MVKRQNFDIDLGKEAQLDFHAYENALIATYISEEEGLRLTREEALRLAEKRDAEVAKQFREEVERGES